MKRMGICQKCGKETVVRDHHWQGYGERHKDDVVPYCFSCDKKAHAKVRKEGKCKLTGKESAKLSRNSWARREKKRIKLSSNTIEPNARLIEILFFNLNTKHIEVYSYFEGNHGKKLKIIDELKNEVAS